MIDNNEDILDINIFTKLLKTAQNSSNFEIPKIPFLYGLQFLHNKKRSMHNINLN